MSKPNITTDDGIVADGHSAKNGRIGIYRDVVSDNGMSWDIDRFSIVVGKEILRSECHTLIESHVVTDDACLAYHHTRAMVDGKKLPYLCPGVDVDAGGGMGLFGKDSGENRHLHDMQLVCHPVMYHGLHHGIAENDLTVITHCRVIIEDSLNVGKEQPLDLGEAIDETQHDFLSLFFHGCLAIAFKEQCQCYLLPQQDTEAFEFHAYVIFPKVPVAKTFVEIAGKDDVFYQLYDGAQRRHRWQLPVVARGEQLFFGRHFGQFPDIFLEYFVCHI